LYFVVCVQCRRKESSRSLSHLLMSFLFSYRERLFWLTIFQTKWLFYLLSGTARLQFWTLKFQIKSSHSKKNRHVSRTERQKKSYIVTCRIYTKEGTDSDITNTHLRLALNDFSRCFKHATVGKVTLSNSELGVVITRLAKK